MSTREYLAEYQIDGCDITIIFKCMWNAFTWAILSNYFIYFFPFRFSKNIFWLSTVLWQTLSIEDLSIEDTEVNKTHSVLVLFELKI